MLPQRRFVRFWVRPPLQNTETSQGRFFGIFRKRMGSRSFIVAAILLVAVALPQTHAAVSWSTLNATSLSELAPSEFQSITSTQLGSIPVEVRHATVVGLLCLHTRRPLAAQRRNFEAAPSFSSPTVLRYTFFRS